MNIDEVLSPTDSEKHYFSNVNEATEIINDWIDSGIDKRNVLKAVDRLTEWEIKSNFRSDILNLFDRYALGLSAGKTTIDFSEYGSRVVPTGGHAIIEERKPRKLRLSLPKDEIELVEDRHPFDKAKIIRLGLQELDI